MNKILIAALGIFLSLSLVAVSTVFAKGPDGPTGNSNKAHLYLYEKDSAWNIVDGGAWGKMTYNQSGPTFDYVFNGHGLVPDNEYTLIYYPDPWPGTNLKCLGNGTANGGGNVNISGTPTTGSLPIAGDTNISGAKIWLVKPVDVQCEGVTWSVKGTYVWSVFGTYFHDVTIDTQNPNGTFSGTAGYPAGNSPYTTAGQTPETITGQVTGNQITFTTTYLGPYNPGYSVTVSGTIAPDGTISGTSPWAWSFTGGSATSTGSKMVGWNPTEYLFENNLIKFTSP